MILKSHIDPISDGSRHQRKASCFRFIRVHAEGKQSRNPSVVLFFPSASCYLYTEWIFKGMVMTTELSAEQKRQFFNDGYIVIKGAVSDDLVDAARARIKAAKKGESLAPAEE